MSLQEITQASPGHCTMDDISKGHCSQCYQLAGDIYQTAPPNEKIISAGVIDTWHQSIYSNDEWDTFIKRTVDVNRLLKHSEGEFSTRISSFGNEVSLYINPNDPDYKGSDGVQLRMLDAVLAVLFLPQECNVSDIPAMHKISYEAARTLSTLMRRSIPCVSIDYEAYQSLSLWDPDRPIKKMQDAPYNMKIEPILTVPVSKYK
jgi:hypothetical protein